MKENHFLNGNYIQYSVTSDNYTEQPNYVGAPPRIKHNNPCTIQATDGKYGQDPPYYQLGPVPCQNCPFYNYLLPYNYPWVNGETTPDPKNYWYFPYYYDPTFYQDPYQITVPKGL